MNKKLFIKGEIIYVLLSSYSQPNILIPVKGIVKDFKYDEINPIYLIKIIKFFDNIIFLKKYFLNMSFSNKIGRRPKKLKIDPKQINKVKDLEDLLNSEKEHLYYVVVDSIMCTKHKFELKDLFNKIQNHLIEKNLRQCRDYMTRVFYSGKYKLSGEAEYNARLKNFIGDKVEMNFNKYVKLL